LAIPVAAASVQGEDTFQVYMGTNQLSGGVNQAFLVGIHNALYALIIILVFTSVLSFIREKELRKEKATKPKA
jgi:hypothetical protein